MGLAQNEVTRQETEAGNLATQLGEAVNTAMSDLADQLEATRRGLGESLRASEGVTRAVEEQERDRGAASLRLRRMSKSRFESDTPRKAGGLMSWAASKAVGP